MASQLVGSAATEEHPRAALRYVGHLSDTDLWASGESSEGGLTS